MKRRRLKSWVVSCMFMIGITSFISLVSFLATTVLDSRKVDNNSYVLRDIADSSLPIVAVKDTIINKPYVSDKVNITVNFYDHSLSRDELINSLVNYNNTYMPSTGIMYQSDEAFDVVSILDGEVIDIEENDIFSKIVTVKHENNIVSKYSSLNDVVVKKGDHIIKNQVVGRSGKNKIVSGSNSLFFELIYNGNNVNPEKYYNIDSSELT